MKTQLLHIKQYLLLFGLFLGLAFMVSCSDDEDDDKKDDASAKPVFLKPKGYSATITENAAVTDNLKTVKATLEGGEITYQFGDAKTANPLVKLYLAIDAKTGKISTKKVVDYEDPLLGEIKKVAGFKANSNILIPVPVEAVQKDKPENKSSVILTITIVNVDEAPTFDDPGTRTITLAAAEASTATALAPAGDPVIATDPDAGAMAVTYALYKTGTTASAEFQINSTSGQISATPDAAFTSPSYPVSVKATSGSKSATQPVTITVTGAASSVTFEDPPESGVEFDVATDTQIANYKVVKTTGAIAVDDVLVTVSAGTGFTYTFSTAGGATATYTGYFIAAGVITATAAIADVVGTANDREFFVKATKTADANVYKVARVALTLGAVDPITTFAPAVPAESYSVLAPVTGTVTMTSIDTYTVTRAAADVDMAGDHVLTVEAGPSVTIYSLVSTFAGAANAGTDVTGKVKIDPLSGVVTTKAAITGTLTFYVKAVNGLTAGATFQRVAKVDLTVGAAALAFEAVDLEPNVTFVAVAGANAASYALTKTVESLNAASYAILTVALAGSATTTYSLVTDATGTTVSTGTKLAIASSGVVSTTSTSIAVADSPLTFYVKAMRGSSAVVAKVVLTVGKEIPFAVSAANFTQGVLSSIDFVTVFATGVLTITLPDGFSGGTIGTVLARTSPAVTGAMTSFASDGTVNTNGVLSLPVATNITYTAGVLSIVPGRKTQAIAAATSIASANNFYFEIPAATGYVNRVIRLVLVAAATPSTFMPAAGDLTIAGTALAQGSFASTTYTIDLYQEVADMGNVATLAIDNVTTYTESSANVNFNIDTATGVITRIGGATLTANQTMTITLAAATGYTPQDITVIIVPKFASALTPAITNTGFIINLATAVKGDPETGPPLGLKLSVPRSSLREAGTADALATLVTSLTGISAVFYDDMADFRSGTASASAAFAVSATGAITLTTAGETVAKALTYGGDMSTIMLITKGILYQVVGFTVSVPAELTAPTYIAGDITGILASGTIAYGTPSSVPTYTIAVNAVEFLALGAVTLGDLKNRSGMTYGVYGDGIAPRFMVSSLELQLTTAGSNAALTAFGMTNPVTVTIRNAATSMRASQETTFNVVIDPVLQAVPFITDVGAVVAIKTTNFTVASNVGSMTLVAGGGAVSATLAFDLANGWERDDLMFTMNFRPITTVDHAVANYSVKKHVHGASTAVYSSAVASMDIALETNAQIAVTGAIAGTGMAGDEDLYHPTSSTDVVTYYIVIPGNATSGYADTVLQLTIN